MNTNHLSRIFANYIEKFEYINNTEHHENYKWIAAKKFRELMDAALTAETGDFAALLYKAKVATVNIIDSYITPFNGLVEFAHREPEMVRNMLLDLYADDGADLGARQKKFGDCVIIGQTDHLGDFEPEFFAVIVEETSIKS